MSEATAELATFSSDLDAATLSEELAVLVKRHLLDQLGIQLACGRLPWVEIASRYARTFGPPGVATLVGETATLGAEHAAFANAIAGHGFELDDFIAGASAHPGCVIVSSALAVAEEASASGRDTLAAMAVGFEAIARIALAVSPSLIMHRGFHQTGTEGVFGAALAAGRLLGLSADGCVNALGIAGSHASGTTQFSQFGGDVKRLHAGLGAMGGVRAARLTSMGFTAPPAILEGKRGFLQAFCQEYDVEAITDGLGSRWEFSDRASLKVYPCAGAIAPRIDAAIDALDRAGRSVGEVAEIVLGLDRKAMGHLGGIGPHPENMTAAQFSVEFVVALALVKGSAGFDAFVDAEAQGFADPTVRGLAERIRLEFDSACEAEARSRLYGTARLTFVDGTTSSSSAYARGEPGRLLTQGEVEEKFFELATRVIPEARARRIVETVDRLESLPEIGELTRLLVPKDGGK